MPRRRSHRWSASDLVAKGLVSQEQRKHLVETSPGLSGQGKARHRRDIEEAEQIELIDTFESHWPELGPSLLHIPNGGSRRNRFEGYRLKRAGVRKGASDLLLAVPVRAAGTLCPGFFMEFKAAPPNDAAVTPDQKRFLALMASRGYHAQVCRGVDEAMNAFDDYLSGSLQGAPF